VQEEGLTPGETLLYYLSTEGQGCQIFLGPNIPKWGKIYQTTTNYIYKHFSSKALQNLSKLIFLV
jgi:hypothetical protein